MRDGFMRRSGNWRNVFDVGTRHSRPRSTAGAFAGAHDPASSDGFAEGSSAQYTWLVPHDPAGLIAALGGREPATARLDDLGTMSAWYVLAALGVYPAVPGTDVLALSGPLFPRADVRVGGGTLRIRAAGAMPGRPYVKALRRNGKPYGRTWLRFASLRCGARLDFRMAGTARPWGSGAGAAPPSFGPRSRQPKPGPRCR